MTTRVSSIGIMVKAPPPRRYNATCLHGSAALLEAVKSASAAHAVSTGFQTQTWLSALCNDVAPQYGAAPLVVVVTDDDSGKVVLTVPMVVRTLGGLRVAEFADLGLSDYCTPQIGGDIAFDAASAERIYVAIKGALDGIDIVRFEKMPERVDGSVNPLAFHDGALRSGFVGNRLVVATTVEDFIASRGKKYRKEAARSRRRLEDLGEVHFARAETPEAIASAYRQLERWQSERHREAGHDYWLDRPEVSGFYLDMLLASIDTGRTSLFTLSVDGELAAALLGVAHGETFTLLRIADGGERWRHCSPGRMVVLEAMNYLVASGIRTFDMGIGDYPFKRWIGCEAFALYDVEFARTIKAYPTVLARRVKRRLKNNQRIVTMVRRIKGLRGGARATHSDD